MQQLQQNGTVRVSELAEKLEVNPVTIRRDLKHLEEVGQLHRVHGGAVLRESRGIAPQTSPSCEARIAEAAARLLPDQSVLFLGPGSIVVSMIPFLKERTPFTIVTNALDVAWNVARLNQHTLHLVGGQLAEDYGIYGDPEALLRIHADWVVLECNGLDAEHGLGHDQREYATMARMLFKLGAQVIVLLSPERVGRSGALHIAPASEVDVLITGREASNAPLWDLSEAGVRIVLT